MEAERLQEGIVLDFYSEACEDREALLALVQELKAQVIDYSLLVARLDETKRERDVLYAEVVELREYRKVCETIAVENKDLKSENSILKMRLNEFSELVRPVMDAEMQAKQLGRVWTILNAKQKATK